MTTFDALSARRRTYIDAARENGFEEGLRKLLADLYPDNAHFIYELLQNAEDASAREVRFLLRSDGLRVEHDGTRLFDLRDIDSITGIGQSTKADDETSIGKFGVGFKAVFAYTQTPVIHSGKHSFAIHDLFVPSPVPPDAHLGWTTFWFPFDRPEKPADIAVGEVASALREISGTTLLFLTNIQSISCSLPTGDERLLRRRALDEHLVEIESTHPVDELTYWYRIAGNVDVSGSVYSAGAAFALEAHTARRGVAQGYSVTPIDGQVFIYFPAVRETSGLKFHVHAPFASTVARDSVRDDPGNDALLAGIATLVAETLPLMRDAGLMTDGLLSALPNRRDELPSRFAVIREKTITAFEEQVLTPMVGGGHAASVQLFRADQTLLRTVLSVDDANFLRQFHTRATVALGIGWLPVREGRASSFLSSVRALPIRRNELSAALECVAKAYGPVEVLGSNAFQADISARALDQWNDWLHHKPDEWIREFYLLLKSLVATTRSYDWQVAQSNLEFASRLCSAPLIRVRYDDEFRHVPGAEAYLPSVPGLHQNGLVPDQLAVFDAHDGSGTNDHELRTFYNHAEVRPWDTAAQLDAQFKDYREPAVVSDSHVGDLETLIQLLLKKAVDPSEYRSRAIFVATRRDGSSYWAPPRAIFLDAPFMQTGLGSLYQSDAYLATLDRRQEQPPGPLDAAYSQFDIDIASLASKLGSVGRMQIVKANVKRNPEFQSFWDYRETHLGVEVDWTIPHLDAIINTENELLLAELWRLISSADEKYADAIYRSNNSSQMHEMKSKLLQILQSSPWILDRDGNMRRPDEASAEDLAVGLSIPETSPFLAKLGFDRKTKVDDQRRAEDAEYATRHGYDSAERAQKILAMFRDVDPEQMMLMLAAYQAGADLPNGASADPEQRAIRSRDSSGSASKRSYEKRVRSVYVQVPGHLSTARGYLRNLYTNESDVMFCQLCSQPMPFKIKGEYYFVAAQFVKDSTRDFPQNRLALCPVCAAKFQHTLETPIVDLRDDLLTQTIEGRGSITVDIVVAGEESKLRFVGKHAIDLQAALDLTECEDVGVEFDEFSESRDGEFSAYSSNAN